MIEWIYLLCAATSVVCTWLLFRSYLHNGYRLLFWSGLCFAGISINNILLVLDKMIFPFTNLLLLRLLLALIPLLLLLYGLIYEEK